MHVFQFPQRAPATCLRRCSRSDYVFLSCFEVYYDPPITAHYGCKTSLRITARFPVTTACARNMFECRNRPGPCVLHLFESIEAPPTQVSRLFCSVSAPSHHSTLWLQNITAIRRPPLSAHSMRRQHFCRTAENLAWYIPCTLICSNALSNHYIAVANITANKHPLPIALRAPATCMRCRNKPGLCVLHLLKSIEAPPTQDIVVAKHQCQKVPAFLFPQRASATCLRRRS